MQYHAIADILLSLYDDNFKKIVEDFEAVEQKVGNVRIIYSTAYNPDISPGTAPIQKSFPMARTHL